MTRSADSSTPSLSLDSTSSEDWDRSVILENSEQSRTPSTPRNSIVFPGDNDATPGRTRAITLTGSGATARRGKRSLSELLRLHADHDTDVTFSQEEAMRVADVLGQWINASSSPYEGEDDFFSRSQDDLSLQSKKSPKDGRPRGQSESVGSRPTSSAGSMT